jgi:hypothetical protein
LVWEDGGWELGYCSLDWFKWNRLICEGYFWIWKISRDLESGAHELLFMICACWFRDLLHAGTWLLCRTILHDCLGGPGTNLDRRDNTIVSWLTSIHVPWRTKQNYKRFWITRGYVTCYSICLGLDEMQLL